MGIWRAMGERVRMIIGAVTGAVFLFVIGAALAFLLSPQQAALARKIERMPDMDAAAVSAAQAGAQILVTGHLEGNRVLDEGGFVAYTLQEWEVTPPDADDDEDEEPDGTWKTRERIAPDLNLVVGDQDVQILRADGVSMSGPLHEDLIYGTGWEEAKYEGEWLPEGSLRIRGFLNGDLVTVWGKRASSGRVIPDELYAGDRVAFADSKRKAAQGLLIGGLCMMGASPFVVVAGIVSAVFGRRRRMRTVL
jgi:hypothetical protein